MQKNARGNHYNNNVYYYSKENDRFSISLTRNCKYAYLNSDLDNIIGKVVGGAFGT